MYELLAIFRSRSQAMDCYFKMKAMNLSVTLINTPKEANVGCGLSLKIPHGSAGRAKSFISRARYSAFYGYMKIDTRGGRFTIKNF